MSASDMVAGRMIKFLKKRSQQPTPSADPNLKFFESLMPYIEKLSSKRIRIFKFKVLGFLNDLLEDQEHEDLANFSAPSPYASTPSPYASTQYGYTTTPTPPVAQSFQTETERDGYADINTVNVLTLG